jgi:hypothetical protein
MRKVMYWGAGFPKDSKPGIFHCWAGTSQDAYALIEDTTTGEMNCIAVGRFRFVQPPETRVHKGDLQGMEFYLKQLNDTLQIVARNLELLNVLEPKDIQVGEVNESGNIIPSELGGYGPTPIKRVQDLYEMGFSFDDDKRFFITKKYSVHVLDLLGSSEDWNSLMRRVKEQSK